MRAPQRLAVIGVVVIALAGGGLYIDHLREAKRSTLSGFFESRPTDVSSRVGGRVQRLLAVEGQFVHKGDILAVLEADASALTTEASRQQATQAEQLEAETVHGSRAEEVVRQRAIVDEMAAGLERLKRGSRPEEIAAARHSAKQAEARYLAALHGPRPQEIEAARAAERQARAALAAAQRGLTPEERAQAQARYDAAKADADVARTAAARTARLYAEGASSQRENDDAQARTRAADAKLDEAANALRRAQMGTPKDELDEAIEAHRQAQARLDLTLAGTRPEEVAAAKAEMGVARDNLRMLLNGSRVEDVRASEARLQQAQAQLNLLVEGNRVEKVAQAKAGAKAARFQAQSSEQVLGERVVVAPTDGVVEKLLVAKGDLVAAGAPLVRMSDPSDIWVKVYVPEKNLSLMKVGDDCELRVDGVNEPLPGTVAAVATQGEFTPANLQSPEDRGKQVFAVQIRLKSPDPRVKAGMSVTAVRIGRWR